MKTRLRILIGTALLTAALLTGCSNDEEGRGDSPVGPYDDSPAAVINFPDWFANVAHKCDGHGHRVYTSTREAPPVVLDDPSCPGAPSTTTTTTVPG